MKQIIIFLLFLNYCNGYPIFDLETKEDFRPIYSTTLTFNCDPVSDSLQLVSFYNETGGDDWINKWDFSTPVHTWYGVLVNDEGCVLCLDFDGVPDCSTVGEGGNNLTGNLIDINLPFLEFLYCANNHITGNIPDFDSIPNLTYLDCRKNQFTGNIPDFINLVNLERFHCDSNQLSGSIPDFSNLPNLQKFYCQNNQLSDAIPDFSNLSNLELLFCNYNNLTGSIPNFLNLPSLIELNCSYNELVDTIPNFTNLPNLETFYCQKNQLVGGIPSFEAVPNLSILKVRGNILVGAIPDFTNFPNMHFLDIKNNYFTFEDILPTFDANNNFIDSFYYTIQNLLTKEDIEYHINQGDALTLEMQINHEGIGGVSYMWYKDSILYDSIYGGYGELEFLEITPEDEGGYLCFAVSDLMPGLGILSGHKVVNVNPCPLPNTDSLCFEIIPNQLIIDLSNNDSFGNCDSMRMALIDYLETDSNNIYEYRIDYCNCDCFAKVTFESDSIVDLIGIHERKKGIQKELDVDTEYEYLTNEPYDTGNSASGNYSVLGNPPLSQGDYSTVYVIDSGVNRAHPEFTEDAFAQNNDIGGCGQASYYNSTSIIGYDHFLNMGIDSLPSQIFEDTHGHGTHVAGNILNKSSGASKLAFGRIISNNGSGSKFGWICAMYDAINHNRAIEEHNNQGGFQIPNKDKIRVSNISLGWQGDSDGNKVAEKVIVAANEAGIIIVTSAGNNADNLNENPNVYPICFDASNIIGVAAVESDNGLAQFSNTGVGHVDIAALGVNLKGPTLNNDISLKSGTSQAVSLVVGELAYLAAKYPNLDNTELIQMLYDSASVVEDLFPFVNQGRVLNTITLGGNLPVELIGFSARLNEENHVLLEWETATEINNSHFVVERMTEHLEWATLGEVKGRGTTTEYQNYSYTDLKPATGLNYYRLKQVDFDGLYQYSETKAISLGEIISFGINPNPIKNELYIEMNSLDATKGKIRIVNSLGDFISDIGINIKEGFNYWNVDASYFSRGVYIITLEYNDKIISKKILKE